MDYGSNETPVESPYRDVEVRYIEPSIVSDININTTVSSMWTCGYVYEDSKVFPNNGILLVFRKKD